MDTSLSNSPLLVADTGSVSPLPIKPVRTKAVRRRRSEAFPTYGGVGVVCDVIGKERATVFRWVAKGLLPSPFKLKGSTQNLWDIGKVIACLENHA
jgi:predicted DNA-binding transcriptional regulator AlpA